MANDKDKDEILLIVITTFYVIFSVLLLFLLILIFKYGDKNHVAGIQNIFLLISCLLLSFTASLCPIIGLIQDNIGDIQCNVQAGFNYIWELNLTFFTFIYSLLLYLIIMNPMKKRKLFNIVSITLSLAGSFIFGIFCFTTFDREDYNDDFNYCTLKYNNAKYLIYLLLGLFITVLNVIFLSISLKKVVQTKRQQEEEMRLTANSMAFNFETFSFNKSITKLGLLIFLQIFLNVPKILNLVKSIKAISTGKDGNEKEGEENEDNSGNFALTCFKEIVFCIKPLLFSCAYIIDSEIYGHIARFFCCCRKNGKKGVASFEQTFEFTVENIFEKKEMPLIEGPDN